MNLKLRIFFILLFFSCLVLFLRFLYGPKGIWRDTLWDNAVPPPAENISEFLHTTSWLPKHEQAFFAYAQGFDSGIAGIDALLHLKQDHTRRVLQHALVLAEQEPAFTDLESARALVLAALYHDVGRFVQFRTYHTFADALSCNHGQLGVRILQQEPFLREEAPCIRKWVKAAVGLHNRFSLPSGLPSPLFYIVKGLRDADKLDIMQVMQGNLGPGQVPDQTIIMHLQNSSGVYSASILESLRQGRIASFRDMRVVNDFRLLLCTWLYDLHFATTRQALRKARHLEIIVAGLDGLPEVQKEVQDILGKGLTTLP